MEAYGTVDELNSLLGLVRAFLRAESSTGVTDGELDRELEWVQNKLFDLGGLLATAPGQAFPNMPTVSHTDVTRLEHRIDQRQEVLPPLKEFILPGGGVVTSLLHVARTVCRRAERLCVRLGRTERLDPMLVTFLNRLSDALFVFARHHAHLAAEPEPVWRREPS